MKHKNTLTKIIATTGLVASTPIIAITSCNKQPSEPVEPIVDPTQEEKIVEPEVGTKQASYHITLSQDAKASDIKVDASLVSNDITITTSVVSVENKVLTFSITADGLENKGDTTIKFNITVSNTVKGWSQNIEGYQLKYKAQDLSAIELNNYPDLQYASLNNPAITIKSHTPVEAKIESIKYESSDPSIISINETTGIMNALKPGSATIKAIATDSHGVSKSNTKSINVLNTGVTSLIISGARNLDIDNTTGFQINVKDNLDRDQTSYVEWSVLDEQGNISNLAHFDGTKKGLLKLDTPGKTNGGTITIKVRFNDVEQTLNADIGSFNKLDAQSASTGSLKAKDTSISGTLVVPNNYYDSEGNTHKLTKMGQYAFKDCVNLTSIRISKSLTDIDAESLDGCSAMEGFIVDENNPYYDLDNNCLYTKEAVVGLYEKGTLVLGCKSSIVPTDDKITQIGPNAFKNIQFKTHGQGLITISKYITKIGQNAFSGCGIYEVTFAEDNQSPNGIEIDDYAFNACSSLMLVEVGESTRLSKIGRAAFMNDILLVQFTNVSENSFGEIGVEAFKNTSIGSFGNNANNGITKIDVEAFANCVYLSNIHIPYECSEIGAGAFLGCDPTKLKVTFDKNSSNQVQLWSFSGDNGDLCVWEPSGNTGELTEGKFLTNSNYQQHNKKAIGRQIEIENNKAIKATDSFNTSEFTIYDHYIHKKTDEEDVEISTITEICADGFKDKTCITSLDLRGANNYLTNIGANAFSGCSNISTIQIGSNVTKTNIGTDAFRLNRTNNTTVFVDAPTIYKSTDDCEGLLNKTWVKEIYFPQTGTITQGSYIMSNFVLTTTKIAGYCHWIRTY